MNKKKVKENENKFIFISPPPIKVTGVRFPEWSATWRIDRVYLKTNLIEIRNPYFDYFKALTLDIVRNFDEDYKVFRVPYSINGIMNLNALLRLDGYHVIVEKNIKKWKEWHHKNYRQGKRTLPVLFSHVIMQSVLSELLTVRKWDNGSIERMPATDSEQLGLRRSNIHIRRWGRSMCLFYF